MTKEVEIQVGRHIQCCSTSWLWMIVIFLSDDADDLRALLVLSPNKVCLGDDAKYRRVGYLE